ncbi:putative L,D-transpeptidase YbiS precursor [compost metagenome]
MHNPLSTSEEQIDNNVTVPVTLTSNVQAITGQQDVDATIVEQAINNRSGMPVRLN